MPRKNSTTWNVGDGVTSARLNAVNSDLDDLYSGGSDRLKLYQNTGDGLTIRIGGGNWRVGDSEGTYPGGSFTVSDNTTTYVMLDSAGNFQYSNSAWNSNYARIGRVVSSGGSCTIVNNKVDAVGGLLSGKGIPDMSAVAIGTPISYSNQTMYGPEFRPQAGPDAGFVGIPGMDGIVEEWTLITYGNWTVGGSGQYVTQLAYSNNGNDSNKNYIYMRHGNSDTVWGTWERVSAPANFLTFNSTVQAGDSQSVYLQYGGFVDADYSFRSYTSNTIGIYLQISSDNSNWTTIAKKELQFLMGYNERYVSSISLSGFVPHRKYVRFITQNLYNPYSIATNLLASVSIWPFNI